LSELKTSGKSDFKYGVNGLQQLLQGFKKLMNAPNTPAANTPQKDQGVPGLPRLALTPEVSCTLHRVEANDLAFPVLVNNQPLELPALHAACKPADSEEETNFYFLDDPDNPLALAWQQGETSDRLQVIKLTWPPGKEKEREQPSQQIAQQLAATRPRSDLWHLFRLRQRRASPGVRRRLEGNLTSSRRTSRLEA
jgi:hypothetical protein